jgi:hypothetical protein
VHHLTNLKASRGSLGRVICASLSKSFMKKLKLESQIFLNLYLQVFTSKTVRAKIVAKFATCSHSQEGVQLLLKLIFEHLHVDSGVFECI